MKTISLIRDSHGRLCFMGSKATEPSKNWLLAQAIPFEADAVFYTAYPLEGGSVIVDKNTVVPIGNYSGRAAAGEMRHSVLVALWYALDAAHEAYSVPAFHQQYYNPEGDEEPRKPDINDLCQEPDALDLSGEAP